VSQKYSARLDEITSVLAEALEHLAGAVAEVGELDDNCAFWLKPEGGLDRKPDEPWDPRTKMREELDEHVRDLWREHAAAMKSLLLAKDSITELWREELASERAEAGEPGQVPS
jgi:hypothetical protein